LGTYNPNIDYYALTKRYEEMAHLHRLSTRPLWAPTFSVCAIPTNSDFASWDKIIGPYMDGSYFQDGVGLSYVYLPFTPGANWGPEAMCDQSTYEAQATAWANHLKSKGWWERSYVYCLDEPDHTATDTTNLQNIAANASSILHVASDWKSRIMDTVAADDLITSILNPAIGIYTTTTSQYGNLTSFGDFYGREQWAIQRKKGLNLWMYEANGPHPPFPTFSTNTLIATEPLFLLWGAWFENATGYLYWDIADWNVNKPWGVNDDWGKIGDGMLLYPGGHNANGTGSPSWVNINGPIASLRLKSIRDGFQDWALFQLASQLGLGLYTQSLVNQVYNQLGGCIDYQGVTCPGTPSPQLGTKVYGNGGYFWDYSNYTHIQEIRYTVGAAVTKALSNAKSGAFSSHCHISLLFWILVVNFLFLT